MTKILVALWLAACFLLNPSSAQAARLAPSFIDLSVDKGQQFTREITITNNEKEPFSFALEGSDVRFSTSGIPQFLSNADIPPDSLLWWLNYEPGPYALRPGESRTVPIVLNVPANAAPGGHYGAILVRNIGDQPSGDEKPTHVTLQAKIASLLFVEVAGKVERSLGITTFTTNRSLYSKLPIEFTVQVQNSGNTHLQPHGLITIAKSLTGKEVARRPVNADLAYLFPGATKQYNVTWRDNNDLPHLPYFGPYKATLTLSADRVEPLRQTITFWIIPAYFWWVIAAILIVIVAFLYRVRPRKRK